jgi:hypothetical protein
MRVIYLEQVDISYYIGRMDLNENNFPEEKIPMNNGRYYANAGRECCNGGRKC